MHLAAEAENNASSTVPDLAGAGHVLFLIAAAYAAYPHNNCWGAPARHYRR